MIYGNEQAWNEAARAAGIRQAGRGNGAVAEEENEAAFGEGAAARLLPRITKYLKTFQNHIIL